MAAAIAALKLGSLVKEVAIYSTKKPYSVWSIGNLDTPQGLSLIEKTNEEQLSHVDVPKTTTLLLICPRGSGKRSLVNKLSRMFEDNLFAPERAHVSYNSSAGSSTYFIQEYMIPRGSSSFCVYDDTRSLSDEIAENLGELQCWMKRGIRRGIPV